MEGLEVHIVNLPPMRVACVNGFGQGPEGQAIEKMKAWVKAHNLLGKPCRQFGYNNPDPTPGSPNYGYDIWITVDGSVNADVEARIIDFPGGLYAVTRCEVNDPGKDIPAAWQMLFKWMQASPYHYDSRNQWLEEHLGSLVEDGGEGPFTLDLYLPVSE